MSDAAAVKTLGTFLVSDQLIEDGAAYTAVADDNATALLALPPEQVVEALMLAAQP